MTDLGEAIGCKIGTIPMVIYARDKRCPFAVGKTTRIKRTRGAKWEPVIIRRIDPDGYFQGDLM